MSEKLGSFSFDVAKRILDTLHTNGPLKKTNLATKTGLNYNTCLRYIDMLRTLDWLDNSSSDVSITGSGDNIRRRLSSLNEIVSEVIPEVHLKYLKTGPASISRNDATYDPSASSSELQKNLGSVEKQNRAKAIMIVDDEPDVAFTYRSFLASEAYDVKVFSEPYGALRSFASTPNVYELVVLDIRMPDINGLQLYQSLKAMNPSCKFLFVSSLDAAKELLSVLPGLTEKDILRKPVRREQFLSTVSHIVGK